jgi:hypothetical protein
MAQPLTRNRARVLALALGALGLVALAGLTQAKIVAPATSPALTVVQAPTSSAERPPVAPVQPQAEPTACRGAYVTGDLAGDASPTEIYAAMCGSR